MKGAGKGLEVLSAYFLEAGGVQLSLVNDLHSYLNIRQKKPEITSLARLNPGLQSASSFIFSAYFLTCPF